ncbi:MAG TPA: SemiSWEET transporter [Xanthobacteraceae bacterium]|jgi:MtN3 and saliva related transmembrane protein|nr:SemiSWEET transporter [Xanthobacteraceae bacterium]
MLSFATIVGFVAAVCTTIANVPQLYKCWTSGSAGDLSLYMLLVLASGLALWVAYGVMQQDYVVLVANFVSFLLISVIVVIKVREMLRARREGKGGKAAQA